MEKLKLYKVEARDIYSDGGQVDQPFYCRAFDREHAVERFYDSLIGIDETWEILSVTLVNEG